eukprot:Rmarinus@m.15544
MQRFNRSLKMRMQDLQSGSLHPTAPVVRVSGLRSRLSRSSRRRTRSSRKCGTKQRFLDRLGDNIVNKVPRVRSAQHSKFSPTALKPCQNHLCIRNLVSPSARREK